MCQSSSSRANDTERKHSSQQALPDLYLQKNLAAIVLVATPLHGKKGSQVRFLMVAQRQILRKVQNDEDDFR